jgi:tRNA G46 methylase TrmB
MPARRVFRIGRFRDMNKRSVRSFVRRTGRMTAAQERAMERLWPHFGVDFSPAAVNLDEVFGREAYQVLEIGFGDGETLVDQAAQNPAVDYLGVEVHRPGVGHCLLQADAHGVGNLRVICHDAVEVLEQQIADQSFRRVNLYFPDPWPKKKHHKRRLLQPDFLNLVASKLIPGGACTSRRTGGTTRIILTKLSRITTRLPWESDASMTVRRRSTGRRRSSSAAVLPGDIKYGNGVLSAFEHDQRAAFRPSKRPPESQSLFDLHIRCNDTIS